MLKGVFPADSDSFEERPSGSSALLAFAVSEGIMLEGSVVLSACAWAAGRALDPGPAAADWLDGFADIEGQFAMRLEEIYLGWEDGEKHPTVLRQVSLAECLAAAAEELGVAEALGVAHPLVLATVEIQRYKEHDPAASEREFLVSRSPPTKSPPSP